VIDPLVAAGIAAASAASVSAVVVAWQAFETRRAASAAVASLDLTRAAQGAAEQSLAAAVQLAAEAARSRRDARAPRIDVRLEGEPDWPPLEPSPIGEPQPLLGTEYRVPRDEDRRVLVRQRLLITNQEAYPVALQAIQIVPADAPGVMNVPLVHVPPGETVSLLCQEARSLRAWIEVAEDREAGRPGAEVVGGLWHSDSYDDGVVDYWRVRIGGCPVRSIPAETGGWFVVSGWVTGATAPLDSGLDPRRRRYFMSKAENRELV